MTLNEDLEQTGIELVPTCNLCGHGGKSDTRWARLLALPSRYGVQRCRRCRLRWLSPRPASDGLAVIYGAEHYFGVGETPFVEFASPRLPEFHARVERMMRSGAQSVLDYGAATGDFVQIARSLGMQAEGVEFSVSARELAAKRGIILHAPSDDVGCFDVIHMNHVLEHVPDPVVHLGWCAEHLTSRGSLWIEVPVQFDNDLDRAKRLSGRWRPTFNAFSMHHTYFFSKRSLRQLCRASNFAVTSLQQTYMVAPWRMSGLRRWFIMASALRGNGDVLVLKARKAGPR